MPDWTCGPGTWPAWASSYGPVDDLNYGYLWWTDGARDAFFAWGYGGQFVYVMPSRNLVVVATTDWRYVSQDVGADALTKAVLDIVVNRIAAAALR